jgi:hypothetical protein
LPQEASIREAIDAASHDPQVSFSPVASVYLAPGRAYNIADGLLPAINSFLADADRAHFRRLIELNSLA